LIFIYLNILTIKYSPSWCPIKAQTLEGLMMLSADDLPAQLQSIVRRRASIIVLYL
jgi:hypothetical protein